MIRVKQILSIIVMMFLSCVTLAAQEPEPPIKQDEPTSEVVISEEMQADSQTDSKTLPDVPTPLVASCGGQDSPGNPYPCGNGGNCTWWAWRQAKNSWGVSLPGWSHAKTWANSARNAGFPISYEPTVNTIGVNTWQATGGIVYGHVGWVEAVSGDMVFVSEMYYGSPGVKNTWRHKSYFDAGYISRKSAPAISWMSPSTPYWSWYTQDIWVYGSGFSAGSVRVEVTFPSGTKTILSGAQVPYSDQYQFRMRILIGSSGWWSIRALNNDGARSNLHYFYVY